jgi:putative tryptophan/tyrosine transport system substrate-binding protein
MRRRDFIALLGGTTAAWPLAARGQQDVRVARIGLLINTIESDLSKRANVGVLLENLAKLGWTEGRNLRTDLRWSAGDPDLLQAQAAEIVRLGAEVIVADAGAATRAAQRATRTIPIVYMAGGDPAITGLVHNIARPEGNVTGLSGVEPSFAGKWLELLKEAAPHLTRVAVVDNPELLSTGMRSAYLSVISAAGATFAVQVTETPVRDPIEIVRTLDAFAAEPNGGLIILPTTTVAGNGQILFRTAQQHRLPTIYSGDFIDSALMSFGPDTVDQIRHTAAYVDRLLRGAKVSELPIQFPTKYKLIVSLKTAKALGLTIGPGVLAIADEVIE